MEVEWFLFGYLFLLVKVFGLNLFVQILREVGTVVLLLILIILNTTVTGFIISQL